MWSGRSVQSFWVATVEASLKVGINGNCWSMDSKSAAWDIEGHQRMWTATEISWSDRLWLNLTLWSSSKYMLFLKKNSNVVLFTLLHLSNRKQFSGLCKYLSVDSLFHNLLFGTNTQSAHGLSPICDCCIHIYPFLLIASLSNYNWGKPSTAHETLMLYHEAHTCWSTFMGLSAVDTDI